MFGFRPEIDLDEGASAVQGFQNGQSEQKIAQCSLMHHHDSPRQGRFQADY